MDPRASRGIGGHVTTVVISLMVHKGREDDYRRWQVRVDEVARGFAGFEDTELYPPESTEDNTWVVVYRFTSLDQLTAWLNSSVRRQLLDEGRDLFEGVPRQEVLAGEAPSREVVTAVISHDVRPGREQDYIRWQGKVRKAQERFPGFMGVETFEPVPGVQENWVAVIRFDTREHLDDWLDSETRQKLLEEGRDYFVGYDVRKVKSAFSGWFRFGAEGEQGIPPDWKQAMCVLLALYPTVMVLNLTVSKWIQAAGVPGYLDLFIGNILSVAILTWLLMPLVNKALGFWLAPARAAATTTHLVGTALVVLGYLLFIVVFGVITS